MEITPELRKKQTELQKRLDAIYDELDLLNLYLLMPLRKEHFASLRTVLDQLEPSFGQGSTLLNFNPTRAVIEVDPRPLPDYKLEARRKAGL